MIWTITPRGSKRGARILKGLLVAVAIGENFFRWVGKDYQEACITFGVSWFNLLKRSPCPYCGRKSNTWDHIVPKSNGGKDDWRNLINSCSKCNFEKHSNSLLFFLVKNPISLDKKKETS